MLLNTQKSIRNTKIARYQNVLPFARKQPYLHEFGSFLNAAGGGHMLSSSPSVRPYVPNLVNIIIIMVGCA